MSNFYPRMSTEEQIAVRCNQAPFIAFWREREGHGIAAEETLPAVMNRLRQTGKDITAAWHNVDAEYIDWINDGTTADDNDPMLRVMLHLLDLARNDKHQDAVQYMFETMVAIVGVLRGKTWAMSDNDVERMFEQIMEETVPGGPLDQDMAALARQ